MESEERNRAMDHLKDCWDDGVVISLKPKERMTEAIRECDHIARQAEAEEWEKKAKAWDALETIAAPGKPGFIFSSGDWEYLRDLMKQILSPTPKDPLEELENSLKKYRREYETAGQDALAELCDALILDVRRLRGANDQHFYLRRHGSLLSNRRFRCH
jgi:hypothetical protein